MASLILDRRAARDAKREANPYALTPAVRATLAYIAISGNSPKGAHVDTWSTAIHYSKNADFGKTGRFYIVPEEHAGHYTGTPLWKAHAALLAAGFTFRGNVRVRHNLRISKNLRYERVDRDGNGFSAELTPQGYLFGHVVKGFLDQYSRGAHDSVNSKHAGTLPRLFTEGA